jgi:hypothetical protein
MWPQGKGPKQVVEVPRLEPKDLYEKRVRRDYARLRAYNQLLEQIYHRVYATSQLSGNTASVLYSVPPFIFGLPKLDMEDCIVYLVWQLRQAGFEVRFTWPNMLFISWKHTEGDYLSKQNPIIQAMLPEPPPPPRGGGGGGGGKKKAQHQAIPPSDIPAAPRPTVSFSNQDIDLLTGGGGGKATPRRAAEYEPPASFIQSLERPTKASTAATEKKSTSNVLADLWSL